MSEDASSTEVPDTAKVEVPEFGTPEWTERVRNPFYDPRVGDQFRAMYEYDRNGNHRVIEVTGVAEARTVTRRIRVFSKRSGRNYWISLLVLREKYQLIYRAPKPVEGE